MPINNFMTAKLETVISRPSLDEVFFFEALVDFNVILNQEYYTNYINSCGEGFISTEVEHPITWEEIESRKSELRPDLVEMLKYKRPLEPLVDSDFSVTFFIGAKGEPPFNPFSLTYTFWHTYETYDQLISAYNTSLKNRIFDLEELIRQTKNVGVERCFVDGVEVEFRGAFAELAEKEKAP